MAATGNEVPTLDQLKDYISFASDEDATAYFEASDEEASAETGKKVLTAAQLKSIAASLGGGGSSGSTWTTIFEGNYTCSNTGALEIEEDTSGCSKLQITAKYVQYSHERDSGTFEFDNVDFNYQYAHTVGMFELYSQTFTVQMMKASTGLNINVTCSTSSYTRYCRITKVEVM